MKRLLRLVLIALGAGSAAAIAVPMQPAHATEVVRVCVGVSPKPVVIYLNGNAIGGTTPGAPRTCVVDI